MMGQYVSYGSSGGDKIPGRNQNLKEGNIYFVSQFQRVKYTMVDKSGYQQLEVAGYMASTIRKQRLMNAASQPPFSSSGDDTTHSGWSFQSRKSSEGMPRGPFPR